MTGLSDYNPRSFPRMWTVALVLVVLACAVFPFDGLISDAAEWLRQHLGGDANRELEALQQYGQFGSMVAVSVGFVLLQPWRARRVLDLMAAAGLTWAVTISMKMLVGRPRPKFGEPGVFLGPWGRYLVSPEAGERHAWEFWGPISSDLWSMPSSHTAFAMMFSVFLGSLAPRLRPLLWILAAIVGLGRLMFGGHYPSDVLVGAAVGWVCGWLVVRHSAGVRGLDRVWKWKVNPNAPGAYGRLVEAERTHGV